MEGAEQHGSVGAGGRVRLRALDLPPRRGRVHLGWQARRSGGRKDRSLRSYRRRLRTTWEDAETYRTANPRRGDDEIAAIIAAARALADDPRAGLTDNQANVLRSACDLAAKYGDHGTARPALPLSTLEDLTGLSRKSVLNALVSLGAPSKTRPRARGLLVRDRRGDVRRHLAALYRLPDLAACAAAVTPPAQGEAHRSRKAGLRALPAQGYVPFPSVTPSVTAGVTPAAPDATAAERKRQQARQRQQRHRAHGRGDHSLCTHPPDEGAATGEDTRGVPGGHPAQAGDVNDPSTTPTTEEDQMITVTVSGRDAEALTARLAELLAGTGAQVAPAPRTRHLTAVPTTVTRAADVGKAGGR